jgi:serine/threonine-protein kinase
MELISGHTLRDLIHKGERVPLKRALEIGEGILAALEYSHHSGIVHRDIKPANIMITDNGDVKVMDFGIARALADLGATLTSTWNVVGTAQYLSPEQALGEVADLRSDIYSTGCLLYEVLTGKPPFTGETPVSIAYQHVSGVLVTPSSIVPELPAGVDTFLTVALAKNPDDRYQSAGLMLDDLYKIKTGEVLTTKISKQPVSRRKVLIGAISGVAAAGVLIAGLFLARPDVATSNLPQLPNVVGLTEAEAKFLLTDYVVTVSRAFDGRIPKDRVASQVPLATTRAQKGSGVVLVISDGPGNSEVPIDLVGLSLLDARSALASVGLFVASTEAVPSEEPQGTVLKVTPVPGSMITAGSGVVLQIASGEVSVPLLLGIEALQAKTLLVQAGFLVREVEGFDANQLIGVVIRQAPDGGTTQTIGKSVTITINKAP